MRLNVANIIQLSTDEQQESEEEVVRWGKGFTVFWYLTGCKWSLSTLYLHVEQSCWFCSVSMTKLPWRQWKPKPEEIYEHWKRKVEWAQHNVMLSGIPLAWQVSIYPNDVCWETLIRNAVDHSTGWRDFVYSEWSRAKRTFFLFQYFNDSKYKFGYVKDAFDKESCLSIQRWNSGCTASV